MSLNELFAIATDIVSTKAHVLIPSDNVVSVLSVEETQELLQDGSIKSLDLWKTTLVLEAGIPELDDTVALQVWNWVIARIDASQILTDRGQPVGDSTVWSCTGYAALTLLEKLSRRHATTLEQLFPNQLVTLIFWAVASEDWIKKDDSRLAAEILSRAGYPERSSHSDSLEVIVTGLLEQKVRPAFNSSRPRNITAEGRQAIEPIPQALTASEDEALFKLWKFKHKYAVDVLEWALHASNGKIIQDRWPLIAPPVLSLIDDETTRSKIRGCKLVKLLLEKVPKELWSRTGLGTVLTEAIMPALSYLPPLTDHEESLILLKAIYPTLLALCDAQFSGSKQQAKRDKMLDNILRTGVLSGLYHSREYVDISVLLLQQLSALLLELRTRCVKHLKHIVPALVAYLCDPFALASPKLLLAAISALQEVILNAWPRMERWSGEVFRGVAICCEHIHQESEPEGSYAMAETETITKELRTTLRLLNKALGDSSVVRQEILDIVKADSTLAHILGYE